MPRIVLERHAYAPELNRAHVMKRGRRVATLPAPGCLSIRDARAALFPAHVPGPVARVTIERPAPWDSLNKSYCGRVATRADALAFAREIVATRHAGGPLRDGRTLPPASYRVALTF